MDTPNKAGPVIQAYADKFLAVLTRIAVALETPISVDQAVARVMPYTVTESPAPPVSQSVNLAEVAGIPEPPIPYDTVRKAVMAFQDVKGALAAQNVLKSFGARYIMDLKAHPEKFADVLAALQ
jgi:hypothetical protein